jgi:hypothetical protein
MARACFAVALLVLLGGCVQPQHASEPLPPTPVGEARDRYRYLPHMGPTAEKGRGILDLERGYYQGDLLLEGTGLEKKGAGIGETVIDGNVTIVGDGWRLTGMLIRGDVEIRGDDNDVSTCRIQGQVRATGERNHVENSP